MRVASDGASSGGLTLALTLHEAGIEAEVFEQASVVRELGVGVNPRPHAIKELVALGLPLDLDRTGIRTRRMISMARRGQTVWDAPRGVRALEAVARYAEREAIVRSYASLAGAERGSCLQGDSTPDLRLERALPPRKGV